ncbi:MAG: DNA methyltransferase [Fuerstiella sp.]|nr:DNA methyltransferase [Fuerstiella sp.]
MKSKLGMIHNGDCIEGMNALPTGSVDLAFADPPFNIGYKYDVYEDRMAAEDYLKWSRDWMTATHRVLKPDGTFWLAIGDDFAAELKIEAQKIGFHCRSWVIWYYTFGVNCKNKFTRSHTHLFHFVKDVENFTFRSDDLQNRVPSARMLVYNDKRGNPKGRLPDDTWIIPPEMTQTFTLRPQDLNECYQANESDWYFPRVAGTFKERAGFHGCQMPEQLLGRIVRTCSEENEIVLDPFSGSASTLVVAKKLNRQVVGFELSEEYAKAGSVRLAEAAAGHELTGAPEPTMSAPRTWQKKSTRSSKSIRGKSHDTASDSLSEQISVMIDRGVLSAYAECRIASLAELTKDEEPRKRFVSACRNLGIPGQSDFLVQRLQDVFDRLPAEQQRFEFSSA